MPLIKLLGFFCFDLKEFDILSSRFFSTLFYWLVWIVSFKCLSLTLNTKWKWPQLSQPPAVCSQSYILLPFALSTPKNSEQRGAIRKVGFGGSPISTNVFFPVLILPVILSLDNRYQVFFFWEAFLTALLKNNLYTIKLTHFKCIVQWFLVNCRVVQASPLHSFRIFLSPPEIPGAHPNLTQSTFCLFLRILFWERNLNLR